MLVLFKVVSSALLIVVTGLIIAASTVQGGASQGTDIFFLDMRERSLIKFLTSFFS